MYTSITYIYRVMVTVTTSKEKEECWKNIRKEMKIILFQDVTRYSWKTNLAPNDLLHASASDRSSPSREETYPFPRRVFREWLMLTTIKGICDFSWYLHFRSSQWSLFNVRKTLHLCCVILFWKCHLAGHRSVLFRITFFFNTTQVLPQLQIRNWAESCMSILESWEWDI